MLRELARRGYAVVEEPGRRIVQEQLATGGTALPWVDAAAFARRALAVARADCTLPQSPDRWVFFDRGVIDAAAALQIITGAPAARFTGPVRMYHRKVFLTPPWPEIYCADTERRHGLEDAISEYDRLAELYPSLGYTSIILPKTTVAARADFVVQALAVHA